MGVRCKVKRDYLSKHFHLPSSVIPASVSPQRRAGGGAARTATAPDEGVVGECRTFRQMLDAFVRRLEQVLHVHPEKYQHSHSDRNSRSSRHETPNEKDRSSSVEYTL
ncbi:hypothetical protein NECAME_03784 [Necator americanus]|uniref:Uncharacterized protein n=1 Tax=Necator americanus TaxID=51031 RepID=W2T352_NECAM|nr:hypothetical protein NECAME_03784 [Necator americanus]ETN75402.1 hypothetical protein NECAME_03784 [Necator americanus]